MITQKDIKNLNRIKHKKEDIISIYVPHNPTKSQEWNYSVNVQDLLKELKRMLSFQNSKKTKTLLEKIKFSVTKPASFKGLAIFASLDGRFWREFSLSISPPSLLVLKNSPYLKPLLEILDEYERFAVALVDRVHARFFLVYLGKIIEERSFADDLIKRHDQGGMSQKRYQRHIDGHADHHLRNVAQALYKFVWRKACGRILLGGTKENLHHFKRIIHPDLRQKIVGEFHIDSLRVSKGEILKKALMREEKAERAKEKEILKEWRELLGKNKALDSLEAILLALQEKSVQVLLVRDGYKESGWQCINCGNLVASSGKPKECPYCKGKMIFEDNIIERALNKALEQGSFIEFLPASLLHQNFQNIGAVLRF